MLLLDVSFLRYIFLTRISDNLIMPDVSNRWQCLPDKLYPVVGIDPAEKGRSRFCSLTEVVGLLPLLDIRSVGVALERI